MNYHEINKCDVTNGLGIRISLYLSGCKCRCRNCHNPETWDFNGGMPFDESAQKMLFEAISKPYIKGLTLSGGNPLDNYESVLELLKTFKNEFGDTKDVWLYSGYTLEEIIDMGMVEILDYIDVLVDGRYVDELRDLTLAFRGSSNQRILYKGKDF
ncbi:MAG: anaerobic ribonucleoside-triphosphate reductase activating protein [Bacilli bacterium]|nr:anaerobic ribonucleoside-triphosphate reductase activating protein [Bacilli bacterium]